MGECKGGQARVGAGHVGDAVVDDAMAGENGIVVAGGARGLDATALVDTDIDDHRAGLHTADHLLGDDVGRAGAHPQHSAHHEVGIGQLGGDTGGLGDL